MKDENKTKNQLIHELVKMRKKIADLEEIIIEVKRTKKELKESEKKYRDLVEETPIGIANIGITGKIIYINQRLEKISGYSREEIVGKGVFKLGLFSDEMLKILKERLKVRFRLGGGSTRLRREIHFKCKDGKWIWIEITAKLIKKLGIPFSLRITVQDITERKKVEEELRDSEERLKILFDYAPDAYYINDLQGKFINGNKAAERMIGHKREELTGKNFLKLKLLSLTDIPKAAKLLTKNLRRLPTGPDEFVLNRKDNTKVTVEISTYPVKIKGRTLVLGIARDITERKKAEEKIKHLNLVLRAIREVNQLIIKVKNRESLIKGMCNNLVKTRGYYNTWIVLFDKKGKLETYAEAGLGKAFLPMIELLKESRLTYCGQKALRQQEVVITEDPVSNCPECPLVHNYSGRGAMTVRLEYNEKVYGLISVSIPAHFAVEQEEQNLFKEVAGDIAFAIHDMELDEERKLAEENVKKAKDELQMILDSVPAIIFYKDTEGRIIRVNKALADSLKMPVKDIISKTTEELFPRKQAEKMRKDDQEVMISGKAKRNIIQLYTTPDGARWVITDKVPHKDKEGKITGIISLSKDITVQRKSEQELKQTYQKLQKTMDTTIQTMSKIIESKDPYTAGHQQRVSQLATAIAKELNLSPDKIKGIRITSLIHDIGKIGLPTEILSKPTTLTDIEFSLIKGHSQIGYDILKSIDFSYPIAQIVLQHHERLDGSGYPNNLKGDEIILEAHIIGVADVVEAMSSFRPYRPALGIDVALEEISQNKGILYDPEVVDACLRLFKEKGFKFE